jgi:hypothetical protein
MGTAGNAPEVAPASYLVLAAQSQKRLQLYGNYFPEPFPLSSRGGREIARRREPGQYRSWSSVIRSRFGAAQVAPSSCPVQPVEPPNFEDGAVVKGEANAVGPTLRAGLKSDDAARRLVAEGFNELPSADRKTPLRIVAEPFTWSWEAWMKPFCSSSSLLCPS